MIDTGKIIKLAEEAKHLHPLWRWGQAVFNTTHQLYPQDANVLVGTSYDCFYDDQKVGTFLEKLSSI